MSRPPIVLECVRVRTVCGQRDMDGPDESKGGCGHDGLTDILTGNAQLLEAAATRAQVLPRRGGPEGAITQELHFWLPRGMCYLFTMEMLHYSNNARRLAYKRQSTGPQLDHFSPHHM